MIRGNGKFWILLSCLLIIGFLPVFAGGTPEPPKILDKSGSQHFSPNNDLIRDEATIEFDVELYVKSNKDGYIPEAVMQITDAGGQVVKEVKHTEKSDVGFFGGLFSGFKKFKKKGWLTWDGKKEDGSLAPEGAYNFILTVKDASNKPIEVSLEEAFVLDLAKPKIAKLIVDSTFSPNNDGSKDTLMVRQEGSDEVLWVGTFENVAGVVLKEFTWENGRPKDFEWDGIEEDGSQYTYGLYQYRLSCTDLAGNSYSQLADTQIVLDNTETSIGLSLNYTHFSPNGDAVQDEVSISLATKVKEGLESWYVRAADVNGPVKRSFEGTTEAPSRIVFDGKDDRGSLLPDGEYWITYGVNYVKGDQKREQAIVTIDTKKPEIDLVVSNPTFSPNGDNSSDTIEISMQSNEVVTWIGRVLDSKGRSLMEISSEDTSAKVVLDGLDSSGNPAPEGSYLLKAVYTDRAGNSVNKEIEAVLDLTPPDIIVSADPVHFSPDGDGVKDTVTITLSSSEPVVGKGEVVDPSGKVIFSIDIPETTSEKIVLDGLSTPGMPFENGTYTIRGEFSDAAGNRVAPGPLLITRDDRPVAMEVAAVQEIFSPNGDGVNETLQVDIEAPVREGVREWSAVIEDSAGRPVKAYSGTGVLPESVVWDGSANGGKAPEGIYSARVTAEWDKGGKQEAETGSFKLDVTPPEVIVMANSTYFSPDGDGVKDTVTITLSSSEPVVGKGEVVDPSGKVIFSIDIPETTSEKIVLDGLSTPGMPFENGTYTIRGEFSDAAGNRVAPGPLLITREDRPMSLEVAAVQDIFSPNGDGVNETLQIDIDTPVREGVREWSAVIEDSGGRPVKTYSGTGVLPESVVWDGSANGGKAPDGVYSARVNAEWGMGGKQEARTGSFTLDITAPEVTVASTASPFIRTDGDLEGEAFITLKVKDASGVEGWNLDILTKSGEIVRSYKGVGDPSDKITWKGEAESGRKIGGETEFVLRIDVRDKTGNKRVYKQNLPIEIIVYRKDGKLYLIVPNIIFEAYKHTLDSRGKMWQKSNWESIRWVRDIMNKYTAYGVGLEAHALNINRGDPAKEEEEEKILQPLTERRAEEVRKALIQLGIKEERISMQAFGGRQPLFSTKDRKVWWKNRRVEFIVIFP